MIHSRKSSQHGISLMVVLLLLVIVSLLGAGAAQISLLGERSSRNDRDGQIAWQSAEAALADAEFDMHSSSRKAAFGVNPTQEVNPNEFVQGCGNTGNNRGLCATQVDSSEKPVWLTVDFTNTGGGATAVPFGAFSNRPFAYGSAGIQPSKPPRYIVELVKDTGLTRDLSQSADQYVFRVTAMGFGPRDDIQSVLQIVYRN